VLVIHHKGSLGKVVGNGPGYFYGVLKASWKDFKTEELTTTSVVVFFSSLAKLLILIKESIRVKVTKMRFINYFLFLKNLLFAVSDGTKVDRVTGLHKRIVTRG
jgi:hypothetical protein